MCVKGRSSVSFRMKNDVVQMKKVLYISNQEVPYRAEFFSMLSRSVDLTVAYQYSGSLDRDSRWASSGRDDYRRVFLSGSMAEGGGGAWKRLLRLLRKDYDVVIIGCYNEFIQIAAMQILRLRRRPFVINLDGEAFIDDSLKGYLKRLALKGAAAYLTAGKESAATLRNVVGKDKRVVPYLFGSMNDHELAAAAAMSEKRNDTVLVLGRYLQVKGMDVAMDVARTMPEVPFLFAGMGSLTDKFISDMSPIPSNVTVIPFIQRDELPGYYARSAALLFPTRMECWGLVVNEAAAYGTPVVSTTGGGSAVEFLKERWPQYLALPGDAASLRRALLQCLKDTKDDDTYSHFLKEKGMEYSIENSVKIHLDLINSL